MSNLYLRKVGLVVIAGQQALDLSQMKITFHITAPDASAPKNAIIRVWNLSDNTAKTIQKEYQSVILQAGYQDANFGVIFQGTIKLIKTGRIDAKDSFVDILAADADIAHQFGFVSQTLAAGSSKMQQLSAVQQGWALSGVTSGDLSAVANNTQPTGGINPRGKVLFGLAADHASSIARNTGCTWSIQNGVLQFTSLTGYQPGEAVVLNSQTGLIGVPEATDGGINVRSLLNPLFKPGGRIQINNSDINQTQINNASFPNYTDIQRVASTNNDGIYRILVVEHEGDTRDTHWYSNLICLNLDSSAAPNKSVAAFGG